MTDLSPTQRRILEAASKQPKHDIREHMLDIKSPAIRDKVLQSMLKHGLVVEDPDADGVAYIVSEAGFAAISTPAPATPIAKSSKEKLNPDQPTRTTKKDMMISLLRQGATISQMMNKTGWQKHSVHGALANLKKNDGLAITNSQTEGNERIYSIV